jgi:DNA-directed RNA polymerase subunit alpha
VHDPNSIDALDFTVRTYNCLKREGIKTVQAIAACTEDQLLDIRNFGMNSLNEVKEKLSERGMRLRS